MSFEPRPSDPLRNFPAASKSTRKSAVIYGALRKSILLGDLTHDSPVTEQSLAQQFNCSQGTVREALLSLQEDGLVERNGYQGTFITRTSDVEAIVMLRLRLDIEHAGIAQIIANITPDVMCGLRHLAALYDDMRMKRDTFGVSEADIAFHMELNRIAHMPTLRPILQRTLLHLHRFIVSRHHGNMRWIGEIRASHTAILDAIEARDAVKAHALVSAHVTTNTIEIEPDVRAEVLDRFRGGPV